MLNDDEKLILRNIPGAIKDDAKFVRQGMEFLYKENMDKLVNRSVKGTKKRARTSKGVTKQHSAKLPLTPEKISILRSLFIERITEKCAESTEFTKRNSDVYFNKLLNQFLTIQARKADPGSHDDYLF